MGRIEKTVFISYRRTNLPWALAIYQDLHHNGYDVFFDYLSIDSGDFEKVILENIKTRAHFLVILTPSALDRCKEPGDWLRREIETAMDEKRNIIPLMLESFDFGSPLVKEALTGKLASLYKFNGLRVYSEYFFEAMDKLRERYLNVAVSDIALPQLNIEAKGITDAQKMAASDAAPVEKEELTAQEWFERGFVFENASNWDEAIRCYSEAIELDPSFGGAYALRGETHLERGDLDNAIEDLSAAIRYGPNELLYYPYFLRGRAHYAKKDLEKAMIDFDMAIRLEPNNDVAYYNRGIVRGAKGDPMGALADFNSVIRLEQNNAASYYGRGLIHYQLNNDIDAALTDFDEAIRLGLEDSEAYSLRGLFRSTKGDLSGAIQDYAEALRLKPDDATTIYQRGHVYKDIGNVDSAIADFNEAIRLKPNVAEFYFERGNLLSAKGDNLNALLDFKKTTELEPENGSVRVALVRVLKLLGYTQDAEEQEKVAQELIRKEVEYNRACFEAVCGNTDKALKLLKIALQKNQATRAWALLDPDLENIRNDPHFKELVSE